VYVEQKQKQCAISNSNAIKPIKFGFDGGVVLQANDCQAAPSWLLVDGLTLPKITVE
jgi:hypothetical protein